MDPKWSPLKEEVSGGLQGCKSAVNSEAGTCQGGHRGKVGQHGPVQSSCITMGGC